jgi:hypothetical protein
MENTFKSAMTTTTLTENGALSYNTTTNARVELFFKLTRDFYQNNNFKFFNNCNMCLSFLEKLILNRIKNI